MLYCIGHWPTVSGKYDSTYFDYVNSECKDVYDYFADVVYDDSLYIYDTSYTQNIDLYHMSATITALMYETEFADGDGWYDEDKDFKTNLKNFVGGPIADQFTSEKYLDALSGWGGDLQQIMVDAKRFCYMNGEPNNIDLYKNYIINNLGKDNNESRLSFYDLVTDVDAVIISDRIKNDSHTICETVREYYSEIYNNTDRFKLYLYKYHDSSLVNTVTNTYYPVQFIDAEVFDPFITPIFKANDKYEVDGVEYDMDNKFTEEQETFAALWYNTVLYEMTT